MKLAFILVLLNIVCMFLVFAGYAYMLYLQIIFFGLQFWAELLDFKRGLK